MCTCEDGYIGEDCGSCDEANLFFDDEAEGLNCVQSECPESCRSSANGTCNDEDPSDTSCACNEGYAGIDCNSCAEGFAFLMDGVTCAAVACDETSCGGFGACSNVEVEGAWTVSCACNDGHEGEDCSTCAEGYIAAESGACALDTCTAAEGEFSAACSGQGSCEWDAANGAAGECACEGNFAGADCGACAEGYAGENCDSCEVGFFQLDDGSCIVNPCTSDSCSGNGNCSVNTADGSVMCMCAVGFGGDDCGVCGEGFEGEAPDCVRSTPPEGGTIEREVCEDLSSLDSCLGGELRGSEGSAGNDTLFLFDATGSMRDDQARLSENFSNLVSTVRESGGNLAIAWFKDNQGCDEPWFGLNEGGLLSLAGEEAEANETALREFMSGIPVSGGCDIPESLWDGVHDAVAGVEWTSSSERNVVVLTDAPFHDDDKSLHSQEEIANLLGAQGVNVTIVNVAVAF